MTSPPVRNRLDGVRRGQPRRGQSDPDRDVIWTEEGVAGAHRFVQRIWRLVGEAAALRSRMPSLGNALQNEISADALALRKAAHRALAAVEDNIGALRFNVAVARIYELVNAIAAALAALSLQRPDAVDLPRPGARRGAAILLVA